MNQGRLNSKTSYLTDFPNNLPPLERFAFCTFCFSQRSEGETRVFGDEARGRDVQVRGSHNDGDLATLASLGQLMHSVNRKLSDHIGRAPIMRPRDQVNGDLGGISKSNSWRVIGGFHSRSGSSSLLRTLITHARSQKRELWDREWEGFSSSLSRKLFETGLIFVYECMVG